MKVFVIGAGSTVSDVPSITPSKRPPLDRGFFKSSRRAERYQIDEISSYIRDTYGIEILDPKNDSLEAVMVRLYADSFHPQIGQRAYQLFRSLLKVFIRRLKDTTNPLSPGEQSNLFGLLSNELKRGVKSEDLTIVTFNQDLHVEKVLHALRQRIEFAGDPGVFNFPYCYRLGIPDKAITRPHKPTREPLFPSGVPNLPSTSVLKLHGSLNWYSVHHSVNPSSTALFNPRREIRVTARISVPVGMTFTRRRKEIAFPVIVPPVPHKAGILHDAMHPIWDAAEAALMKAEQLVVFGYSCPVLDTEASNLLSRSLRKAPLTRITLINPNPNLVGRFSEITGFDEFHHYGSVSAYLRQK